MATLIDMKKAFNKERSLQLFEEILDITHPYRSKCKSCNNDILYYDTKLGTRSNRIVGKSFLSKKVINTKVHYLSICENCLMEKYPDYNTKNKSRVFNQMNKFSKYAYCVNDEDYNIQRDTYVKTTEENMIKKYGSVEGKKRWEKYCKRQAYTNTYEYKKKEMGWSREEFDNYNKSRSVTIDNLINRHGEVKGKEIWENYCEKQSYTKSKEYYVEKYGLDEWNELCKSKAHTYDNYIKWYGDEKKALEKIKDRHNIWNSVSKSSQRYLSKLDEYLCSKYNITTYYDNKNQEYMIITENRSIYYLDYYIKEWNVGIEYNGDLFHANPKMYEANDTPIPGSDMKAVKIWEKDRIKIETIQKERHIKIITIWESELPEIENLEKQIYELRNS